MSELPDDVELEFLARAIRLAGKGKYSVNLNPTVGCVLVRQGKIVGEGYHVLAGQGHAEANALAQAGDNARGATAYVTLEPCSFHGRTPSCAEALIAAGVVKAVVAMLDPDERNAGKGIQKLIDAGIEVVTPAMQASAAGLIRGHVKRHTLGLPYVRLKLAMTLDGKTALANGESRWITSDEARADVQKLRAMSSAIITGVQTVIDDDPALTVRGEILNVEHKDEALKVTRPVFVVDSGLRVPADARLLKSEGTVLACVEGAAREIAGAEILPLPGKQGRVDLAALLRELASRNYNEVLFECGATLAGSLIAEQLVDELVIYTAPRLIGASGKSLLNLPEIDRMSGLIDLVIDDVRQIGPDLKIIARPKQPAHQNR